MGCSSSKKTVEPQEQSQTGIEEKKPRKAKRRIPATLRRQVWNVYVGAKKGEACCFCCNAALIYQMDFHCGHVVAEANGGGTWVPNLRPICAKCNLSMGTQDMREFQRRYFPTAPKIVLTKSRSESSPGSFVGRLV